MKVGMLKINRRTLHDLLGLPESTQIIDVSCDREVMGGPLKIIVTDDGLTEVHEGALIPWVRAQYENMRFVGYQ